MIKFLNRPITPHLTIYVPQISSLFSIWHRITSVYIIIYILFYIYLCKLFFILDNQFYIFCEFVSYIFNYFLFVSLYYHFLNGLKHLFWDLGLFMIKSQLLKFNTSVLILILLLQLLFFKNYLI